MLRKSILAVGNSFSQDAFFYLHDLAAAGGVDLRCVNLYIGGCSLERHHKNIVSGTADYLYELNGRSTGRMVSVNEVISRQSFDFIMTQQASHDSGIWDTYQPHLREIEDFFAQKQPNAVKLLHKTWAYEQDSDHFAFPRYGNDQTVMFKRLSGCYARAAAECALTLIPSGDVIQSLRAAAPFRYECGERSLCRDGYHMDLIYGRYALSATIFTSLFGDDIEKNTFLPDGADADIIGVIKHTVKRYFTEKPKQI